MFVRAAINSVMFKKMLATTTALAVACLPAPAFAGPTGGVVTSGSATISNPSAHTTQINQASQNATLEFDTFNVGANEIVRFVQPNSQSVALNKIKDVNASEILGSIEANGQIFLLNPNGIAFGKNSRVDVGGLVATTSGLDSVDTAAGRLEFSGNGAAAQIINNGTITAADSGLVALVAPTVQNNGTITARLGKVQLQGAENFTVDLYGDQLITLSAAENSALAAAIAENSGTISASGGYIGISAAQATDALNNVVNMSGIVEANTVNTQNGRIILGAAGGVTNFSGSAVADSGVIRIGGGWQGGEQDVIPGIVNGENTVASGFVDVSGMGANDAGSAVIWADNRTEFSGNIVAQGGALGGDGGEVEVSGKRSLSFSGGVDTTAANGAVGNLLLDPTNITITDGAGGADDLEVADGAVTQSDGGASDFIISEQALETLAGGTNINLQATNDITLNNLSDDELNLTSANSVVFTADADSDGAGDFNVLGGTDVIRTTGARVTISGANVRVANINTTGGAGGDITLFSTNSGNVVLLGDLTTQQGNILVSDTALLNGDIALDTGDGAGNVIFGDSLSGAQALTINAGGSGSVEFGTVDIGTLGFLGGNTVTLNGNVTTDNALDFTGLSGLTITDNLIIRADDGSARADVTFSAANLINGAFDLDVIGSRVSLDEVGNVNPLTALTIDASTSIDLNDDITTVGVQSFTGNTSLNGTLATTDADITLANNLTLTGNSAVNTGGGGGDINIGGIVNGSAVGGQSLDLNAGTGDVAVVGSVGATTALNSLTATGTNLTFNGVETTLDQTYNGLTTIGGTFSNASGDITFNNAVTLNNNLTLDTSIGDGNVTFVDTLDGGFNLSAITGAGQVALEGVTGGLVPLNQVTLSGNGVALNTITTVLGQSFSGALILNGDITVASGGIELTGNVTLGSDSVLTAGGALGDDITITGSLVGDNTLELIAGAADLNLNGIDIDTLLLTSGNILNAGGSILTDNALDFTNLGTLNIATAANIQAFDGSVASDILLDTGNILAGGGDLTLLGRNIGLFAVTGVNNLNITSQDGGVVTLNNSIATTGSQTFTGDVSLIGDLTTSNADITFNDNLALNTASTLSTSNGDITILGTTDGAQDLVLDAGAGDVLVQSAIGGNTAVTNFSALGTNVTLDDVTSTGGLTVTGNTIFNGFATGATALTVVGDSILGGGGLATSNGSLTLDGNATLVNNAQLITGGSAGDDLTVTGDITGDFDLEFVAGAGDIILGGSADTNALTFTSGNDLLLNGNSYTSDTDLDFTGLQQVLFTGDLAITADDGVTRGDVTFGANNPILGDGNLSITGGILTLNEIGDGTPANDPASLTVDGTEVFLLGAVRTGGAQTFTSLDGLANDLSTQNADITINSPLDLLADVTISTGTGVGNILFQDIVDGAFSITLDAGTGTVTSQGTIGLNTPLTDVTFNGSLITVENTIITTGVQTFNGPLDLQAGLTTNGGDIFINDVLTLAGATTITTGEGVGGNITFAADVNDSNPLGLIAGTGDITFLAGAGNTTRLSDFVVTSANNVTFAEGLFTNSYTQTTGTGDVNFGTSPGLNSLGDVVVAGVANVAGTIRGDDVLLNPTGSSVGTVFANSLLLGGGSSNLQGIIAGETGREGAREVRLLQFTGGPHIFNGFTLPLIGDIASPQTFVTTALSDKATPSGVTLDVTDATRRSINPFTTSFSLFTTEQNLATIDTDVLTPFWHYYLDDDELLTLN